MVNKHLISNVFDLFGVTNLFRYTCHSFNSFVFSPQKKRKNRSLNRPVPKALTYHQNLTDSSRKPLKLGLQSRRKKTTLSKVSETLK